MKKEKVKKKACSKCGTEIKNDESHSCDICKKLFCWDCVCPIHAVISKPDHPEIGPDVAEKFGDAIEEATDAVKSKIDEDAEEQAKLEEEQEDPIEKQAFLDKIRAKIREQYGFSEDEIKISFPTDEDLLQFWNEDRKTLALSNNEDQDPGDKSKAEEDDTKPTDQQEKDADQILKGRTAHKQQVVKEVKEVQKAVQENLIQRDQSKLPKKERVSMADIDAAMAALTEEPEEPTKPKKPAPKKKK